MEEKIIREIFYYKRYYLDFFEHIKPEVKKKSQKTPKKEIELAERLKKQYFDEKESE
jgi:phage-related protein